MTKKRVSIVISKTARVEYPKPTVCANIVPAMRTPDASFPLRVSRLKTDADGNMVLDDNGLPVVDKVLVTRHQPEGKETMSALKSAYHMTWAYSLCHAITAFFQGANVKGRVYSVTFALNYSREDLHMKKLFDSNFLLQVEMPTSKSNPATLGSTTSTWIINIGQLRDYALEIAAMTAISDSLTEQSVTVEATEDTEPVLEEFEL